MAQSDQRAADTAGMADDRPNADGLFDLGIKAATGRAGQPDLVAAHKWFNLAAQRGNPDAAYHRQQIAEDLSAIEIARAQRAAREWLGTQ